MGNQSLHKHTIEYGALNVTRLNEMIIFSHQFFPPSFFNDNDVNSIQVLIMKRSSFSLLADLEVELKSSPVTHPAITNSN